MTSKELILLYLINRGDTLDNEYENCLQNLRYHKSDEVDYMETLIAKVRRDTFEEISREIKSIITMKAKR